MCVGICKSCLELNTFKHGTGVLINVFITVSVCILHLDLARIKRMAMKVTCLNETLFTTIIKWFYTCARTNMHTYLKHVQSYTHKYAHT